MGRAMAAAAGAWLLGACGSGTPVRPGPAGEMPAVATGPQERIGTGAPIRISYFRFRPEPGGGRVEDYLVLQSVAFTWHRGEPPLDVVSRQLPADLGTSVPDGELAALWDEMQRRGFMDLPAADPLTIHPETLAHRTLEATLLTVHAPGVHKSVLLPDSARGSRDALDRFFAWLEPGVWYLRMRYAARVTHAVHTNERSMEPPLRR